MEGGSGVEETARQTYRSSSYGALAPSEREGDLSMRIRFFTTVTALVLAVAVVTAFGTGAGARTAPKPSKVHHGKAAPAVRVHPNAAVLYDQNADDSGTGIVSQNFTEPENDIYDAQGADNFKLKGKSKIKEVIVTGVYFNGAGPADSVNVTFYKNNGGLPGSQSASYTGLPYTDLSGFGSFDVKVPGLTLKKGTYFVSVQATMAFGVGGEWGWEGNLTAHGSGAAWQNPGDGFGTGCTSYANEVGCIGDLGQGPDFMFTILGKKL
jgi:hypothetical protein